MISLIHLAGPAGPRRRGLRRVAEARGMAEVAKAACVERQSVCRALSPRGNPRLSTPLRVIKAMGLTLTVEASS
ncbi:MAG: hypothetical protein O7D94_12995 [Planctomycetota bacterium]|nr:hypothetical protein [Planctomycetota bacterium]